MAIIDVFNTAVSSVINKSSEFYETFIGAVEFTPEVTIVLSEDVNCGALCNELEFARLVSDYYVRSISLDGAEGSELEEFIEGFVDLPRRGEVESDINYRLRFRFLVTEKTNYRRTTRWAILDALSYFVPTVQTQVIEFFGSSNLYFQVRFEGVLSTEDVIFLNDVEQSYLDQNFVGGAGVGEVTTYIGELLSRIKAAGVDFDVFFVNQVRFTKTSDAFVGTVQMYKISDARVKASLSFNKASDAQIV